MNSNHYRKEEVGDACPDDVVVCCGGSGMHWLLDYLVSLHRSINQRPFGRITLCVPITDNGGSSRAIIDAVGGPAVGDVRNVLLALASRLHSDDSEQGRLCLVLRLRLPSPDRNAAFRELVDGILPKLPPLFSDAVLHFINSVTPTFPLCCASVGNLVLVGLMLMHAAPHGCFASIHRASRTMADVLDVPDWIVVRPSCGDAALVETGEHGQRLPRVELTAVLANGTCLHGQTTISYGTDGVVDKHATSDEELQTSMLPPVAALSVAMLPGDNGEERAPFPKLTLSRTVRKVVLGSGSFYTSTLASAAACVTELAASTRVALLLNACVDRETAAAVHEGASSAATCGCGQRLDQNAVVRLAATCVSCIPWIHRLDEVYYGEGSVFEGPCRALERSLHAASASPRCDYCTAAAAVLATAVFVKLPAISGRYTASSDLSRLLS